MLVTNETPAGLADVFPGFFDKILVDAPCSGEGMFRKDPASRAEWSEGGVRVCAARQEEILREAWRALKPGGTLLYSTCTVLKRENEDVVSAFLAAHGEFTTEPLPLPGVFPKNETGMLTLIPGEYDTCLLYTSPSPRDTR